MACTCSRILPAARDQFRQPVEQDAPDLRILAAHLLQRVRVFAPLPLPFRCGYLKYTPGPPPPRTAEGISRMQARQRDACPIVGLIVQRHGPADQQVQVIRLFILLEDRLVGGAGGYSPPAARSVPTARRSDP